MDLYSFYIQSGCWDGSSNHANHTDKQQSCVFSCCCGIYSFKDYQLIQIRKTFFSPSVVRRKAMVQFQTASLTSIKIWSWLWSWTTPGPLQSLLYSSSCWESREHFKFECMLYHLPSIRYRFSGSQGLCHLIMVNFGWPNIGLYLFIIYYYYLFLKVFLPFKF